MVVWVSGVDVGRVSTILVFSIIHKHTAIIINEIKFKLWSSKQDSAGSFFFIYFRSEFKLSELYLYSNSNQAIHVSLLR